MLFPIRARFPSVADEKEFLLSIAKEEKLLPFIASGLKKLTRVENEQH